MRLIPTKQQWRDWSLPSKLTAISAYFGVLSLLVMIAFYLYPRNSGSVVIHTSEISASSSGPFSPVISSQGTNANVDEPLINFEFALYFKSPVHSVDYDSNRSSANFTGGEYLNPEKTRYHWRGNQIMEDGGWVLFIITTANPPPIITRVCTKVPGVHVPDKKLILPDPGGIPKEKEKRPTVAFTRARDPRRV